MGPGPVLRPRPSLPASGTGEAGVWGPAGHCAPEHLSCFRCQQPEDDVHVGQGQASLSKAQAPGVLSSRGAGEPATAQSAGGARQAGSIPRAAGWLWEPGEWVQGLRVACADGWGATWVGGTRAGAVSVEGLDAAGAWRGPWQSQGYAPTERVPGLRLRCWESVWSLVETGQCRSRHCLWLAFCDPPVTSCLPAPCTGPTCPRRPSLGRAGVRCALRLSPL